MTQVAMTQVTISGQAIESMDLVYVQKCGLHMPTTWLWLIISRPDKVRTGA